MTQQSRIKRWLLWHLNIGYVRKKFAKTRNLWLWVFGFEWNRDGIMLIIRKPFSVLWTHKIEFSFEDRKFYHWQQNT